MTFGHWTILLFFIAGLVAFDLGLLTRRARRVTPFEATATAALWVLAAAGVGVGIAWTQSRDWLGQVGAAGIAASEADAQMEFATVLARYLAAYVVELAMSFDNLAALALVLTYFQVAPEARARVIFWITVGTLVFRALLINLGAWLTHIPWWTWLFAGVLVLSLLRMLTQPDHRADLERRRLIRFADSMRVGAPSTGNRLLARQDGRLRATPLLPVVLAAIATEFWLALDSIPAAFAVVRDPSVAFAANAMAILALRSLYFALQGAFARLRYVRLAVTVIVFGLAAKLLLHRDGLIDSIVTGGAVAIILAGGVIASTLLTRRATTADAPRPTPLQDVADAVIVTRRSLWKVIILIVGTTLLLAAIAIGPLPGPGFIILAPLGLAVLATEFIWARRLLNQLRSQGNVARDRVDRFAARAPLWLMVAPLVVVGTAAWAAIRWLGWPTTIVIAAAVPPEAIILYTIWRRFSPRARDLGAAPAAAPDPSSPARSESSERSMESQVY